MQLISLELDNFRQHRHSDIRFEEGLTGIIGTNGSGKTTILEALAWALYGPHAARGTSDTIRCKNSEGGAKVSVRLVFSLGGHTYTVTRGLDKATLEIDGVTARNGISEVTTGVTQILKMDYRAFFTSFFTEQKQLTFMAGMDGKQKAAAISRMLGYDRLTKARDKCIDDRRGLDREINGLEQGLGNPEDIHQRKTAAKKMVSEFEKAVLEADGAAKELRKLVEELRPRKELSDQTATRHSELSHRLQMDTAQQSTSQARSSELEKTLSEIGSMELELAELAPALSEFENVEQEYRRLQDLQKHELDRQRIQGQLSSFTKDCAALEERIRQLTGTPDTQKKAEADVADALKQTAETDKVIQAARDRWTSDRVSLKSESERLKRLREEVTLKRAEIQHAGEEGKCPTCERELGEELPTVLANFDSQLQAIDAELTEIEPKISALTAEPEELSKLQSEKTRLETHLTEARKAKEEADSAARDLASAQSDLVTKRADEAILKEQLGKLPHGFDQAKLDAAIKRGRELRPLRDKSIGLQAEVGRRPALEKELAELTRQIAHRSKEINASEAALKDMAFSPEQHQKLAVEFESANSRLREAEIETERRRGDARAALAELAGVEAEEKAYKEKEEQLKSRRADRLYLNTLSDRFDKLRIDLDARTRPELEAAASDLLTEMTDGRYNVLEINDSYQATIRDDGELKPVISGGEDDVVNLSLRLAISQMIAERAGQPFSLLILDEVFGSLDDSRRNNVVEMLMNLKNRFSQIIVITHIEGIHDAVDNTIWVEFDEKEKVSRVVDRVDSKCAHLE